MSEVNYMKLFEEKIRSVEPQPMVLGETEILNELLNAYPQKDVEKIKKRFQEKEEHHRQSAFFELVLYYYLKKRGYKIEIDPKLSNGMTPDFCVTLQNGSSFYLEATVANQNGHSAQEIEKNENYFLKKLNEKFSRKEYPNLRGLMIGVSFQWEYIKPIDISRSLLNNIGSHLKNIEIDTEFFSYKFTRENRLIEFVVNQGCPVNPTDIFHNLGAGFISTDPIKAIKETIKNKAKKYKGLDKPFLIAINYLGTISAQDIMQALYGRITLNASSFPKRGQKDCVYSNGNGTRISGIWVFNHLTCYQLAAMNPLLYLNDIAEFSLDKAFYKNFTHMEVKNGLLKKTEKPFNLF